MTTEKGSRGSPALFAIAAAIIIGMASGAAAAWQEPVAYQCESGHGVVVHLDVADETVQSARIEYDGRVFDMFVVNADPALRLSTEQGLAPDHGLQWESEGEIGRLSEMIMDHTAGAPTVIETCTRVADERELPAGVPRISGEVFYLERIAVPGSPVLTLILIDLDSGRTLASASLEAAGASTPFDFFIDAPESLWQRPLGLGAEIRSEGKLWFATNEPVAIDPDASEPLSIRVLRASEEAPLNPIP